MNSGAPHIPPGHLGMGTLVLGLRLKQPTANSGRKSDTWSHVEGRSCVRYLLCCLANRALRSWFVCLGIIGVGAWLVIVCLLVIAGCRSCVRFWVGCWRFVCLGIMGVGAFWLLVVCSLLWIGGLSKANRHDIRYPPAHQKYKKETFKKTVVCYRKFAETTWYHVGLAMQEVVESWRLLGTTKL